MSEEWIDMTALNSPGPIYINVGTGKKKISCNPWKDDSRPFKQSIVPEEEPVDPNPSMEEMSEENGPSSQQG